MGNGNKNKKPNNSSNQITNESIIESNNGVEIELQDMSLSQEPSEDFDDFFENQEDKLEEELNRKDREKKEKEEAERKAIEDANKKAEEEKRLEEERKKKEEQDKIKAEEEKKKQEEAKKKVEEDKKKQQEKSNEALKALYDEVEDEDLDEDKEIIKDGKINEKVIEETSNKEFIKEAKEEVEKKEEIKESLKQEPKKINLTAKDIAKDENELKNLNDALTDIKKVVDEQHKEQQNTDKKPQVEENKAPKEFKLKDGFPSSPDANMRFDDLSNLSKSFIGYGISKDSYVNEIKEMTKNMDGLSQEEKQAEFGRRYSRFYRDNLTQLFNQRAQNSNNNNGKAQLPVDETFDRYEKFMATADKELKESGLLANDYERLKPGTVSSHNIKDAIAGALANQNPKNPKDEKQLNSLYGKLNDKQRQSSMEGLSKNVDALNKQFGTKFNAKNIEQYLAQEFKKCDGLSTKEMQAQFKEKYEAFMKSALNSMLDKRQGDSKNTLNESVEALDKFSKSLEYVLKADGFLDTEYHHESLGGVKKDDIKESLENHTKKLPKTMNEQIEAKLNSFKTLKEKQEYVSQMMDKVPDAKEGVNNKEIKEAMIALNILDKQMANRTTGEKLKHPFQKRNNDKFIEKSQEFLEKKGYDKEVINSVTRNGIKEEDDPIVQNRKNEKDDLSNTMKNLENKEKEREQSIEAFNKLQEHPGKKIEVQECNTINEIVCQKNQTDKNLELQVQKQNEITIQGAGMGKK